MAGGMQIFRPEALERLASPEQLDELMVVTDSKAWVTLWAVGLILVVTVVWSIFGSIPTSVQGSGVLLREGGIYDVQTMGSGQILSLLTEEDSIIEEGQLIALVAQPDLVAQIAIARETLERLQSRRTQQTREGERSLQLSLEVLSQDSIRIAGDIRALEGQIDYLETRLTNIEFAREEGLVTGEAVESVRQQLSQAQSSLVSSQSQLTSIESQRLQARQQQQQSNASTEQQITDAQQNLQLLEGELTEANRVESAYAGRVTQVMVDEGQVVSAGTSIVSVELVDRPLEAMIFVPVIGSKARVGLEAHVQPLTVNWQEHGYIVGEVEFVSSTPVTVARMNRVLKNDLLAQTLSQLGDPYLVEIRLEEAETPTGFAWTSGQGPGEGQGRVAGGVLASAKIIVDEQRPITLVIPALRSFFGI